MRGGVRIPPSPFLFLKAILAYLKKPTARPAQPAPQPASPLTRGLIGRAASLTFLHGPARPGPLVGPGPSWAAGLLFTARPLETLNCPYDLRAWDCTIFFFFLPTSSNWKTKIVVFDKVNINMLELNM